MYLNMCWPNRSHASEDKKWITTCIDQMPSMPATKLIVSLNMHWTIPSHSSKVTKYILTCVDQTCQRGHKMYHNLCWTNTFRATVDTRCISTSQHLACQRGNKIYLNMCWANPSHASEDTESISTCVDQTPHISTRTEYASQHVFNKYIPCQRGLKIYLNLCWPNTFNASKDTCCISAYLDQTDPMTARTENESQHVFTKPNTC